MSYSATAPQGAPVTVAPLPVPFAPGPSLGFAEDTGGALLVGGVALLLIGGIGWLAYKRVQRHDRIAEKEGSAGLAKLTKAESDAHMKAVAAGTASHIAMRVFD